MRRWGAAVLVLLACPARADEPHTAGRAVAQAHCASCHAIGAQGASPLADAPPFRDLNRRGSLDDLLGEGMIASPGPLEEDIEGRRHPRMPQVMLDDAQIADLIGYLRSIQTPRRQDKPLI